jgi:transcriptional regulator with XRE-family HTH domain
MASIVTMQSVRSKSCSSSGLKESYISRIERGTRPNVPLETLQALAGALDVPLDVLIAASRQPAPPGPPPEPSLAGTVDLPAPVARTIQRLGAHLNRQDWR